MNRIYSLYILSRFFDFFKMAAVRHLGFAGARIWAIRKHYLAVFIIVQKFGWNRCSRFHTVKVLLFCEFGLKTPTQAPKIGFLGLFAP